MSESATLLVEVGCEELPASLQKKLSREFSEKLVERLVALEYCGHGVAHEWSTPRRIAVAVEKVSYTQPTQSTTRLGPWKRMAYDDQGNPTRALLGFSRKYNVPIDSLEVINDKIACTTYSPGQPLQATIAEIVRRALEQLPMNARMRWKTHRDERLFSSGFIRPIRWVLLLHGELPYPWDSESLDNQGRSLGHRFLAPEPLAIPHADAYETTLRKHGMVEADPDKRIAMIRQQCDAQLSALSEAHWDSDPALIEAIAASVEWPQAILGRIHERFMHLPSDILRLTMKKQQLYIPICDKNAQLLPHFIAIANTQSEHTQTMREGFEQVLEARLADAEYFYRLDRSRNLSVHLQALKGLTFHEKLGTVFDKTQRIQKLAQDLAPCFGLTEQLASQATQAAQWSKFDLVTQLVQELPDLQGIIGAIYLNEQGYDAAVAQAVRDQYHIDGWQQRPALSGLLALADKMDTLLGLFAAGEQPSGEKDPYGLRRNALVIHRILLAFGVHLDLKATLNTAAESFEASIDATAAVERVCRFIVQRAQISVLEHVPEAYKTLVLVTLDARQPRSRWLLFLHRCIHQWLQPEKQSQLSDLIAAHKRLDSLIHKHRKATASPVVTEKLILAEEITLHEQTQTLRTRLDDATARCDSDSATAALHATTTYLNRYMDEVRVLDDDPLIRENRMAQLEALHQQYTRVSDFSRIQLLHPENEAT